MHMPTYQKDSRRSLSLQEQICLLSGSGLWCIGGLITVSDGPHGVRKPISDLSLQTAHPATCFPAGCAIAASWDVHVAERLGKALARECEYYGISVLLGPAMNLKRHPAGGRNLEYFSEDPVLTGNIAAAYVRGVQAAGTVGACLKHFAVNNQESHRFVVDAIVDERSLRELYLKGFEIAVAENPAMIMGAYNRLNGTYCCENEWLLRDVLRKEWKYDGVCVTDWGATNDRVAAVRAGMDVEMPGNNGVNNRAVYRELQSNPSFIECIEKSSKRVSHLIHRFPEPRYSACDTSMLFDANNREAYEIALDCVVLLKNDDNILPLSRGTRIAVIGEFAKESRYQGMGSSHITPTRVSNAIEKLYIYTNEIEYAQGYPAFATEDAVYPELVREAVEVAQRAEVALLFLGLPEILESEGFDRETLRLPKQHIELLKAIASAHEKTVVILNNGGALELPDCVSDATALLEAYLLGQMGGPAIADLIFGQASPSGRLPETMAIKPGDIPADEFFQGTRDRVEYREGLNIGYRFFDSARSVSSSFILFPFGHGLAYTIFVYSELKVDILVDERGEKEVAVSFRVQNTGQMAAKEVPQCYVAFKSSSTIYRPAHELKAFTKVMLEAGESCLVEFRLSMGAFSYFDIGYGRFVAEPGIYSIEIGRSSRDIQLSKSVTFETGTDPSFASQESYPTTTSFSTDDDSFARRFGDRRTTVLDGIRKSREPRTRRGIVMNRNTLLKEAAGFSFVGKFLYWFSFQMGCREIEAGPMREAQIRMVKANVENLPLRTLVLFSKGAMSMEFMDALIGLMNGSIWAFVRKIGETFWYSFTGVFRSIP